MNTFTDEEKISGKKIFKFIDIYLKNFRCDFRCEKLQFRLKQKNRKRNFLLATIIWKKMPAVYLYIYICLCIYIYHKKSLSYIARISGKKNISAWLSGWECSKLIQVGNVALQNAKT